MGLCEPSTVVNARRYLCVFLYLSIEMIAVIRDKLCKTFMPINRVFRHLEETRRVIGSGYFTTSPLHNSLAFPSLIVLHIFVCLVFGKHHG